MFSTPFLKSRVCLLPKPRELSKDIVIVLMIVSTGIVLLALYDVSSILLEDGIVRDLE